MRASPLWEFPSMTWSVWRNCRWILSIFLNINLANTSAFSHSFSSCSSKALNFCFPFLSTLLAYLLLRSESSFFDSDFFLNRCTNSLDQGPAALGSSLKDLKFLMNFSLNFEYFFKQYFCQFPTHFGAVFLTAQILRWTSFFDSIFLKNRSTEFSDQSLAALGYSLKDLRSLTKLSLNFWYFLNVYLTSFRGICAQFFWLLRKGFEFEFCIFIHSSQEPHFLIAIF